MFNLIDIEKTSIEDYAENNLIEPTDDDNMLRIVKSVEETLISKFKSFQGSTARQVLYRCIKRVDHRDQETQIDHDIFNVEK